MESKIVKYLKPEYEPVAVVWSDTIPPDAVQYKKGRFGCILYLFAEASTRGRVTGGSRETIVCPGGRAALGFGMEFDKSAELLDRHAALFSKGLKSAKNQAAYQAKMDSAPAAWRDMYLYGERRHLNAQLARQWILYGLPHFEIPYEYVLFKPLSQVSSDENIRAVIFPLNPVELSGLITLAGSVMQGTDPVKVPQGADCNSITAFAYAEYESESPRAVLGMLGVDGREAVQKRFKNDVMTLTLPTPLFQRLEQEAIDSVLTIPSWKKVAAR
ncbi:DUF169 domain-containing protein [Dethiosulfatarculus sandiegensis]|uniref:DUF169 domain-containing protein n=1 Tax=Dethiosulfatarculus sandiegensis TaxID=1429043 RepID=A0A0D2J985_9BACT|nr:DUF169 domain-containing protein [Dethiosulfatarculus sandiegensis]KIX14719.1 hypothetical protein X474_06150 [Dethiosulfatarculus sandiegensis]